MSKKKRKKKSSSIPSSEYNIRLESVWFDKILRIYEISVILQALLLQGRIHRKSTRKLRPDWNQDCDTMPKFHYRNINSAPIK